jgi:hypothetical protein
VLWQRGVELEAVVVDDGSSEGTSAVGMWLDSTSHGGVALPEQVARAGSDAQMAGTSSS